MVVAPDYVSDPHVHVVRDHGHVVHRSTIRPHDHEVVQAFARYRRGTVHRVVKRDVRVRDLEEHSMRLPGSGAPLRILQIVTGGPPIPERHNFLAGLRSQLVELILRCEAPVRETGLEKTVHVGAMPLDPVRLVHGWLVHCQAQPSHRVQDLLRHLVARALPVRVLYAEQEGPTVVAGKEVVEQGCPGTADVEVPRRTRRESYSWNCHIFQYLTIN